MRQKLERDAQIKLIANLVAGRVRRVVDARALLDQLLVRALPGFLGEAKQRVARHREVRAGVERDAHRRLSELVAIRRRHGGGRRRGGFLRLALLRRRPGGVAAGGEEERSAQARCLRICLRAGVLRRPSRDCFLRTVVESLEIRAERLGDGAPAPGQVRGGGARRVAHDVLPAPALLFPHLHELAGRARLQERLGVHHERLVLSDRGWHVAFVCVFVVFVVFVFRVFREGFAGTFPGNLTGVFFPELGDGDGVGDVFERGARVRVAARVFREVAAHERSDFGQVVVVVHHELQENARLVRAVRNETRAVLVSALVQLAHGVRALATGRRPVGNGARLGAPDGSVPLVEDGGHHHERGGPGLFGATFRRFRDFAALRLHGARKRRARHRLERVGGGGGGGAALAYGRDGVLVVENAHVLVEGGRGVRVNGVRGADAAEGDHRGGHHAGDQDAGSSRLRRRARR